MGNGDKNLDEQRQIEDDLLVEVLTEVRKKNAEKIENNSEDKTKKFLIQAVRFLYDAQDLRIKTQLRYLSKTVILHEHDKEKLISKAKELIKYEKSMEPEIKKYLEKFPIWTEYLSNIKGVGVRMGAVLLGFFDINRAKTPSSFVKFAGLHTDSEGRAVKQKRGQKLDYDPWVKAKIVNVLAGSLMKQKSYPWKNLYDNYKFRKESTIVEKCMLCKGSGVFGEDKKGKPAACYNCNGTGGPIAWGCGKKHRDLAAKRYMMKLFLYEFYLQWCELEGIEARNSYKSEYLGKTHQHKGDFDLFEGLLLGKYKF